MEDFIEYLANMVDNYKVGIATRDELEEAVNQTQKRFYETRENKKGVEIFCSCRWCGKCESIWVNEEDFWNYEEGELVQYAFPYLSDYEREMLLGTCEECSKKMFPEEEEE